MSPKLMPFQLHYKRVNGLTTLSKNHKGSALVLAIFIMVIMTVLGAALIRMMSSSTESIAYEVLGTRAYSVAQSGVEWQLQQLFPLSDTAKSCPSQSEINSNKPDFSIVDGMNNCSIIDNDLTCSSFIHQGVTYYTITSRGTCYVDDDGTKISLTSRAVEVDARSL